MASVGGSLFPLLVVLLVLLVEWWIVLPRVPSVPFKSRKKNPAVKSYHPWQQNKEYNLFIPQPVYEQGSTRDPRNASQYQPMINILSQGNVKT
ncbi:hypothetical protein CLU79DRAFT_756535, partial [Phycomyces nitens]